MLDAPDRLSFPIFEPFRIDNVLDCDKLHLNIQLGVTEFMKTISHANMVRILLSVALLSGGISAFAVTKAVPSPSPSPTTSSCQPYQNSALAKAVPGVIEVNGLAADSRGKTAEKCQKSCDDNFILEAREEACKAACSYFLCHSDACDKGDQQAGRTPTKCEDNCSDNTEVKEKAACKQGCTYACG